jgi:nicotinate dehydrogenase subunit B
MNALLHPSRRAVIAAGGSLMVYFSLAPLARGQDKKPEDKLPGSLDKAPRLDSWIKIDPGGKITVFSGKVELGQGIRTALIQIAAEELAVAPDSITLVSGDTERTADEGYTAGSHSMQDSGTAILHAAAQVRAILLAAAAERLGLAAEQLHAEDGAIHAQDGRSVGYGELVASAKLDVSAQPKSMLSDPAGYKVIGKPFARVDIPAKVTGGIAYIQDLRLPNMVHARVIRPPSYQARITDVKDSPVRGMPGVVKIIRDGNYLAVIAEGEFQAIQAMRALGAATTWDEPATLPAEKGIQAFLKETKDQQLPIFDKGAPTVAAAKTIEAVYQRPYQIHGSIGPSCGVAVFEDGKMTVWTHNQGVFPLRKALAQLLDLAEDKVHCVHMEGAGCYGHNGADDAAADAAFIAKQLPGRPVRVQWMREHEHLWEPFGPAMTTEAKASLDAEGRIVDWYYQVSSNTHGSRPGGAGDLLAGKHKASPFEATPPKPSPQPDGGGDRNAIPLYKLPAGKIINRFLPEMPLRVSSLRSLGAYMNVFSIESFMDELAAAANIDPVEFRLRHLDDPRAIDVIKAAAEKFGWTGRGDLPRGHGRGFAFARYKLSAAYCAIAAEVSVDRETGVARLLSAVAAVDSGQAVNPDGMRNQIEGGIMQALSWTLYEAVTFDDTRVTSSSWSRYPILRFPGVPENLEVNIINRPGQPYLGTGEASQGPAAAAVANAIAHATGVRIRDLPLNPQRIKDALEA